MFHSLEFFFQLALNHLIYIEWLLFDRIIQNLEDIKICGSYTFPMSEITIISMKYKGNIPFKVNVTPEVIPKYETFY
jgi:hypothetical protein